MRYNFKYQYILYRSVVDPDPYHFSNLESHQSDKLDPDHRNRIRIHLQITSQMYWIGAYLSTLKRVWAFIWKLE